MTQKRDYYEVLGVDKNSSSSEIKKAYRKIAFANHPDRNEGDAAAEKNFKEASDAYAVLSDSQKKQIYDQYGHAGLSGHGHQGFSSAEDVFSNFGSIFEDLFGFGGGFGARQRVRKGADLRYDMQVSFKESILGVEKEIEYHRGETCVECDGSGLEPGKQPVTCSDCEGQGQIRRSQGFFSVATTCTRCGGTGSMINDPCKKCSGSGQKSKLKSLKVKVPPGVQDGVRLRISGEGESSPTSGGPTGDLYVFLEIEKHEDYTREEDHIVYRLPISIAQASLGMDFEAPLIEGIKSMKIPAGTQHGTRIKIKGEGSPSLRSGRKGDFFVEVLVAVPKKLNKRQREILEEFAKEDNTDYSTKKSGFFDRIFS